jgi:hypothetical protein
VTVKPPTLTMVQLFPTVVAAAVRSKLKVPLRFTAPVPPMTLLTPFAPMTNFKLPVPARASVPPVTVVLPV